MEIIITLAIVLFSLIVHEVAHGLAAERFGDDTAKDAGRITLNPIPHIDPIGSILLPLITGLSSGWTIILGRAKPVPVNIDNLHPQRLGNIVVSLAGPLSNFALALLFALIIKVGLANYIACPILIKAIGMNILLGVLNLLPIPPLDGSHVIASLISKDWMYKIAEYEQVGYMLLLLLLFTGMLDGVFLNVLYFFFMVLGLPFQC